MNHIIREYQAKDKSIIIQLFESMQKYAAELDPIKRVRYMPGYGERTYEEMIKSFTENEGKCYVVETDGKVIGQIWGLIAKQSKDNLFTVIPTRLGVIKDFYIEEKYRKQHIGSTLINKMEDYFKTKKCDAVWLQVFAPNQNAHTFYKHKGYIERDLEMLKRF